MDNIRYVETAPFTKSVAFMFVSYWAILVIWQNFSEIGNRSTLDMIVKTCLLAYLCSFYMLRMEAIYEKIIIVWIFSFALIITFIFNESLSMSTLISYIYPVLFMSMVYGIGDNFVITKHHLVCFCNAVILVTMYAAIFAIIFCRDQFVGALSINSAYGNELTSLFTSNHEYGLYLLSAVVSCFLCLKLSSNLSRIKKAYYCVCICILTINLILTFSRTSIFAFAIFLIIFIVFDKGRMRNTVLVCLVILFIIIMASPVLSEYVFNIVLKGNTTSGRDVLYAEAINYFNESNLFSKIFGSGIEGTRHFFSENLGHGSVHNGYLQVLLYYGIFGLAALIIFLISQIYASVQIIRLDRFWGTINLGLVISAAAMMFTNTMIIFTSSIDSYFLTVFMFIIPKYVRNSICENIFEEREEMQS